MSNHTVAIQPVHPREAQPPISPKTISVGESLSQTTRILIVDDEPNLAFILQRVLSTLPNISATSTRNPHDALATSQQEAFDIVITDYQMPEMDGLTLATHIHHLNPQAKIIMLTAHDYMHLLDHSTNSSPLSAVITKPISPHSLRKFISDLLAS